MAECKLHASRDFFKEISIEAQRLKLVVQYIQTYIDQARERGSRIGDNQLLELLDYIEIFFSVVKESSDRLERICARL
ncbi:MAG: hypothetical protein H0X26_08995 [Alphaproteobacteria bacterium]|nr:hypothetical protein [Alphaproteobacteria bacterium]